MRRAGLMTPEERGSTPRQPGREGPRGGSTLQAPVQAAAMNVQAWEMIGPGRYKPRRTRGSFPGRDLG